MRSCCALPIPPPTSCARPPPARASPTAPTREPRRSCKSFCAITPRGRYTARGARSTSSKLYGNLDLRLLEDVLSPAPGELFPGRHARQQEPLISYFILDPHGVDEVAPEEVALIRWDSMNETETIPLAFHRAAEYANGTASGNEHNAAYKILHQDLDVTIEKNGFLSSLATAEVQAEEDGVAVVPLNLYPSLRVSQVDYRQRRRTRLGAGETRTSIPISASCLPRRSRKAKPPPSKSPMAAKTWCFNDGRQQLLPCGARKLVSQLQPGLWRLRHLPHALSCAQRACSSSPREPRLNETNEGKLTTTEWKTETPLPVVGFSLGDFQSKETNIGTPLAGQLTVDAYANKERPDGSSCAESPMRIRGHWARSTPRPCWPTNSARDRWPRKSTRTTSARFPSRTSLSRSSRPATTARAGPCWFTCPSAVSSIPRSGIFSDSATSLRPRIGTWLRRMKWRTSGGDRPWASAATAISG